MERVAARRRVVPGNLEALVSAGESAKVEFKSSARYNRHSGKRDERLEQAVAKTVAGFLNAEGGVLLIGVADDGAITGIEDDYALLKAPDRDRFELWLRDMLTKSLGVVATRDLRVEFSAAEGHDVCLVTAPAARRPAFVHGSEGHDATLFVRLGNSTRELDVEEALTYCVDRWGRRALTKCRVHPSSRLMRLHQRPRVVHPRLATCCRTLEKCVLLGCPVTTQP